MKFWYFSVLLLANFGALSCCVHLGDPVSVFRKNMSNQRLESVQWLPPVHPKVITTIGVDEYYSYAHDFDETKPTYYKTESSRTKRTMLGTTFKPRQFFEQPQDEQIKFLKGAILECGLLKMIDKRRKPPIPAVDGNLEKHELSPYSENLEAQFEVTVWRALSKKYDISLVDFQASLRAVLLPQDAVYSAPLIAYCAHKLAPRYECHYTPSLSKVIKLPSEFEMLIGMSDEGKILNLVGL